MVLISHARQALMEPDTGLALTFGGWFGVELFFALSGFLIGTILIKLFSRGVTSTSLGRFWFRRWMRTLPAYFFILIFYYLAFGQIQFSDFLLLQWPINHNQGVVPVSWSLAVEEWFYIIFPLVTLISTAIFKKNGIIVAVAAAIVFPLISRVYQFNFAYDAAAIRVNPFRFDGMAYGVLAAYILNINRLETLLRRCWVGVAVAAITLFLFDFLRYNGTRIGVPLPLHIPSWHHNVTAYSISGICSALIVMTFYMRSPSFVGPLETIITYVSKISYSLYLWHLFIFGIMVKSFSNHKGALLYFSSIFIAILLSYIPYALIEVPFMKIRDRLTASIKQTKNHKVDNSL